MTVPLAGEGGWGETVAAHLLVGDPPTLTVAPDANGLVLIADVLTWAASIETWCNALRTALIDRNVVVAP